MSELNDRTKIPLAWAMAIVVSLASVVATAAVDQYRVGDLEKKVDASQVDMKQHDKEDQERDIVQAKMIEKLSSMDETLKDIKDQLKENQGPNHR